MSAQLNILRLASVLQVSTVIHAKRKTGIYKVSPGLMVFMGVGLACREFWVKWREERVTCSQTRGLWMQFYRMQAHLGVLVFSPVAEGVKPWLVLMSGLGSFFMPVQLSLYGI